MGKAFVKQIKDFSIGMSPNPYSGDIVDIEHLDTATGQARPYKQLVADTFTNDINMNRVVKYAYGSGVLYILGQEVSTNYGTLGKWSTSTYKIEGIQAFSGGGTMAKMMFWYQGYLFGLTNGTHVWRSTTTGTIAPTHAVCAYTNFCDAIVHSKDGYVYFGTDNLVRRFDGTTVTTGLTLPTNFLITSMSEYGEFLNIVGYDSQTLEATCYQWDRDSSLATVTEKYNLYKEIPYSNATLGGVHFIITVTNLPISVAASGNSLAKSLNIRYLTGGRAKLLRSFQFDALNMRASAHFVNEKLYFHATIKQLGESDTRYVIFELDEQGRISIAQNLAINTTAGVGDGLYGIFQMGGTFFVGGYTDGSWHTSTSHATSATDSPYIDTDKHFSDDFTKSIELLGYSIDVEPLQTGESVILKTRADTETTWTTLGTFDTANKIRCSGTGNALSSARYRQYRIIPLGGAVIIGFQATYEEVNNEPYG